MQCKKSVPRYALALFFMMAGTAADAAETCYFWVMYQSPGTFERLDHAKGALESTIKDYPTM